MLTAAPVVAPAPVEPTGATSSSVARLADPDACIGCGICVDACPRSAIELDDVALIREDGCAGCGECVDACPQGALELVAP